MFDYEDEDYSSINNSLNMKNFNPFPIAQKKEEQLSLRDVENSFIHLPLYIECEMKECIPDKQTRSYRHPWFEQSSIQKGGFFVPVQEHDYRAGLGRPQPPATTLKTYGHKYTIHKQKKLVYISNDGEVSVNKSHKFNKSKLIYGYYCKLHNIEANSETDLSKFS